MMDDVKEDIESAGRLIGASLPRPRARQLVAGRGRYTDDLRMAGTLHAAFLRSPHAHARLQSMDLGPALALPGVVAAYDGAAIGKVCRPWTATLGRIAAHKSAPQPPMAVERALWQGQPVAIVIAESRAVAEDAVALIRTEWEELEALADPAAAASGGKPLHASLDSNVAFEHTMVSGDPDGVFASADRVVRRRLSFGRHTGVPLEARTIVADFDPSLRRLTIHQSTQVPHHLRGIYAELLGLPEADVRIVVPDIGGGFGIKLHFYDDEASVAAAAMLLGRPVKYVCDRLEAFGSDVHARGHVVEAAIAVRADGTVLGFQADDVFEIGAFSAYPRTSAPEAMHALMMIGAPYSAPALRGHVRMVLQNKVPVAAYRGVGQPIGTAVTEVLMDAAAAELGIDPAQMRRRNYRKPGVDPRRTASGVEAGDLTHEACLDRLLECMDYAGLRAEQARARKAGRHLGIGLSAFLEITAVGTSLYGASGLDVICGDGVTLRLEPSGMVTCVSSSTDQGQGSDTGIVQLVADALALPFDRVRFVGGDTAVTQVGGGTWGSRALSIAGEAALQAAHALRERLIALAAALLEVDPAGLALAGGAVREKEGRRAISIAELAGAMHFRALPAGVDGSPVVSSYYVPGRPYVVANGIQASLIELDPDLGAIRPLKHWVVEDAGRIINPLLADEQIRGGVVQGLGAALYEECRYDERGQLQTATLADYLVPMAHGLPDIVVDHVYTPVADTLLGGKGVGEAGTIGASAALLNAVNDALAPLGGAIAEIPCTPERVLRALKRVP